MKVTVSLVLTVLALTTTESYAEHASRQRQAAPRAVRTKPAQPQAAPSQQTNGSKPRSLTDDMGGVPLHSAGNNASNPGQTPTATKWTGPDLDAAKGTPCMSPLCGGVYATSPKSDTRSPQSSVQAPGDRPNTLKGVETEVNDYVAGKPDGTRQTPNPSRKPKGQNLVQGNSIGTDAAKKRATKPTPLQEQMQSENR